MKYESDLVYWIKEREVMRIRHAMGQKPYTTDPDMAGYRWCNVHREDDRVTRWIFDNFLPQEDQGETTEPFALCVARLVNWPETLAELGYPNDGWSAEYRQHFLNTFAARRAAKLKSWTGAYMVTGGYSAGGETKEAIIARVLDGAWKRTEDFQLGSTLEEAARELETPGIGSFLGAQIIADLKNTSWLSRASDWYTWCAPGPGSTMGLNFMMGRDRSIPLTPKHFMDEVNVVREFIQRETAIVLCAQNTQNCLCELSKYIRARYFGERLKNRYIP